MATNKEWLAEKVSEIKTQGYTIIENFLPPEQLDLVKSTLSNHLGSFCGRNNFEGTKTERVYTLVGRDKVFQDVAEDERILALCSEFLDAGFLLTASQAINIAPGESPQPFHGDDSFVTIPRPRKTLALSTIIALDAFTSSNGGTQIIPGSHVWSDDKIKGEYRTGYGTLDNDLEERLIEQTIPLEMEAGSCVVFDSMLLHRGGANSSDGYRGAMSNQYCQPWLRTQENWFLSIPRERVAVMSSRMQELLGYSILPPFIGQLSASHPKKCLDPDYVPPVMR